MKKMVLGISILTILLTGCGKKEAQYEKIMLEHSKQYFENYMSTLNLDIAEITVKMLEDANNEVNAGFDLSKLNNCSKESKVELHILKETKAVESYSFEMYCD